MPQTNVSPKSDNAKSAQKIALSERPHINLTETQEELCKLAADMLTEGGDREDVLLLLSALDRHQYRRRFRSLKDSKEVEKEVEKRQAKNKHWISALHEELSKDWPTQPSLDRRLRTPPPKSNAIAEIARVGVRRRLLDSFKEFMRHQEGVEALWVLNEILENVNSGNEEMAEAFSMIVDQSPDVYLRVPYAHLGKVKEFVSLLRKEGA
jgi:hypothetical protein